jgi:shikimate kinase
LSGGRLSLPVALNPIPTLNSHPLLIACVGLPGSGKSTVGRQLAKKLGRRFMDSDVVIEQRIGCSIREFFEREGEAPFRDIEEQVIAEICRTGEGVLSTGGGAVLRLANRQMLHQHATVIYLHSSPDEVFRRLRHDQNRPLLQVADPLGRLRELYDARDSLYRETAHRVMETGRPTVSSLVHTLLAQLELTSPSPVAAPGVAASDPLNR